MATGPPCEMPSSGNRSSPAASTTAARSSTQSPNENGPMSQIRQPAASLVVPDKAEPARQLGQPVPPYRAFPVVGEVTEPVRGLHKRRARAAARRVRLTEVRPTVTGDIDLNGVLGLNPDVRNGYERITVRFTIKGDAPAEKLREIVEQSRARSAVYDVITNRVPVS